MTLPHIHLMQWFMHCSLSACWTRCEGLATISSFVNAHSEIIGHHLGGNGSKILQRDVASRSRPRRPSPSRRASSPISYRQRDLLRRDSKRSPPRRGGRRSPSPPSPPRRRSSRERRSDRARPASRERTSGKKAAVEAKSKKNSKDSDKPKSKPSARKAEPAKVSIQILPVPVAFMRFLMLFHSDCIERFMTLPLLQHGTAQCRQHPPRLFTSLPVLVWAWHSQC